MKTSRRKEELHFEEEEPLIKDEQRRQRCLLTPRPLSAAPLIATREQLPIIWVGAWVIVVKQKEGQQAESMNYFSWNGPYSGPPFHLFSFFLIIMH